MPVGTGQRKEEGDAIDLLEEEDLELRRLFATFVATRGSGVEERATHGDTGKRIVRHVAIREAARANVVLALDEISGDRPSGHAADGHAEAGHAADGHAEAGRAPDSQPPQPPQPIHLAQLASGLRSHTERRRRLLDHMEEMTRGIQGIALNTGQDFDGAVAPLRDLLEDEMRWDLEVAIPALRGSLSDQDRRRHFPSARFVRSHAPTHLRLRGQKWYDRNRLLTRLRTVYDHMRDYPSVRSEGEA